MKKITLCVLMLAFMTGCMGTKSISQNITKQGTVEDKKVNFPAIHKAWQKDGVFPNSENLSKIYAGVSKDELYALLGRPHFSEANRAREWDYILKFYEGDDVKICQYKVIFDSDFRGQQFYWQPADCARFATKIPAPSLMPHMTMPTMIAQAPIINERIDLSADALFAFDKFGANDMLAKGRGDLNALAKKLQDYEQQGRVQIVVTGHTDHFGDDMYNMNLSLLRAQTVRRVLLDAGVSATIVATGAGESEPIKTCSANLSKKAAIDCLQPNRRVSVDVSVFTH